MTSTARATTESSGLVGLAVPVQRERRAATPSTRRLRLVPAGAGRGLGDPPRPCEDEADEPAASVDVGGLPDPRRWAALLAQAVVEILAGHRPAGQIVRWVDPEIYERVRASAAVPARSPSGTPVRVRRVRVSTALDGTVEAAAVVDDGTRCRALAMRFEALARRWQCTALDLV
jgi:hypothetical protein